MAASVIMPPIAALMGGTMARWGAFWFRDRAANDPLPALTQFWIIGQSKSFAVLGFAGVMAVLLAVAAILISRLPATHPWKITGQLLVTILGANLAMLIIMLKLMAALLPSIVVVQAIHE